MNNESKQEKVRPFPWKCGKCRQREVHPVEGEYTTNFVHDGHTYTVTVPSLQTFHCRNCGEVVLDTEADKQMSQAFRRQIGLLTPEEIRQKRKKLGLKQGELADRLSVAQETLSRWENGWQIQQRSLDKLMRLFFEVPEARRYLSPPSRAPLSKGQAPEEQAREEKFQLFPKRSAAGDAPTEEGEKQEQVSADRVSSTR